MTAGYMPPAVRDDWCTPKWLFRLIDTRWGPFDVDVAATTENHRCAAFIGPDTDALVSLDLWHGCCFMNPPYGRGLLEWVDVVLSVTGENGGARRVVGLLPARTDTRWWHSGVRVASEVCFLEGRVKFHLPGGADCCAPFPSAVVVWDKDYDGQQVVSYWRPE